METRLRVAVITGTRERPAPEQLTQLRKVVGSADYAILGDCPTGIDKLARELCDELGVAYSLHICDWDNESGPQRNARMVAQGVRLKGEGHDARCFAFPSRNSKGTRNCIRLAREAGLVTRVYNSRRSRLPAPPGDEQGPTR